MDWLPLHISVRQRQCLIVGGGFVAARKCELLLRAGAKVTIIAPTLNVELQDRLERQEFIYQCALFTESMPLIKNCMLVIAATDQLDINRQISEQAKRHGVLVNVVDNAELSSVIFPALIDRSPVTISIGSGAQAPLLARFIKARFETELPANIGVFAQALGQLRKKMLSSIPTRHQRQLFMEQITRQFLESNLAFSHQPRDLFLQLEQALENCVKNLAASAGKVIIIGAGPGDPELLTLKAYRVLQNCDVVLYDHLVSADILEYVRRDARKILVGKRSGNHSCTQTAIHQQLLEYAQQGLQVVRLKGGDPTLFSRLGEECEFLSQQQIAYEVIPGITAALGCAASLKIPLTHRKIANGCIFITAHTCQETSIDWPSLAVSDKTLVFYMGVKSIADLSQQLITAGLSAATPMALIIDATRAQEQVYLDTLADLPKKIAGQAFSGPGLIIIGQVLQFVNRHSALHQQFTTAEEFTDGR